MKNKTKKGTIYIKIYEKCFAIIMAFDFFFFSNPEITSDRYLTLFLDQLQCKPILEKTEDHRPAPADDQNPMGILI